MDCAVYRICGSQDGFQQIMARLFCSKHFLALMDLSNDLKIGTKAQRKKLVQLKESVTAFIRAFDNQSRFPL